MHWRAPRRYRIAPFSSLPIVHPEESRSIERSNALDRYARQWRATSILFPESVNDTWNLEIRSRAVHFELASFASSRHLSNFREHERVSFPVTALPPPSRDAAVHFPVSPLRGPAIPLLNRAPGESHTPLFIVPVPFAARRNGNVDTEASPRWCSTIRGQREWLPLSSYLL